MPSCRSQKSRDTLFYRWSQAVASTPGLNPERVARAVASHLLDAGFNSDFLHRWWKYRLSHESPRRSLPELIDEAHSLTSALPNEYDILAAFDGVPDKKFGRPMGWLDSKAVVNWLRSHGFSTAGVKQIGGLGIRVSARDPRAAADAAVEMIDSLAARARIATTSDLARLPWIWVAGEHEAFAVGRRTPGLGLGAMIRENVVYIRSGPEDEIDGVFEMLAPLQTGSPVAAVAAGWAAIEATLAEPDDRGGAAERLASIVACSFPRAELTALSYVLARDDAAFRSKLATVKENVRRARLVAEAIALNHSVSLNSWSDRATLLRMQRLLARPAQALNDVRNYAVFAFRRLYRQRNLVLHGGINSAVALRACLRTVIPLIGAGMDRVAHAHYVEKLPPLALAARAHVALSTLEGKKPADCVSLLDEAI